MARRWTKVLTDVRPLRVSAPYRRLFVGNTIAQFGQQMTVVTVAVQVYALTGSSFAVGLIGVFGLVPLVGFGLYAGAIADAVDRRLLAIISSAGSWAVSLVLAAQAFLGNTHVGVIYACIAVQSACYAATSPARNAMIARLLPAHLLPAASALNAGRGVFTVGMGGLSQGRVGQRRAPASQTAHLPVGKTLRAKLSGARWRKRMPAHTRIAAFS